MTSPSAGYPNPYPFVGTVIEGKYEIVSYLGEGGMGAVAKAMHKLRRAPVALKFISPQVLFTPGAEDRFRNEAVAASQIQSAHVVQIYDVGSLPSGAPYLVMEYLEGRDLSEVLEKEGTPGLSIGRSLHFVLQILRALQIAHAAGIIHRDMKPSNCFIVTHEGEPDFVKILDFGISKISEGSTGSPSLTRTNNALGTPLYMSPEQARSPRDVDIRTDLYATGCILYELLCGRTPHISESGEFTEILFKLFTAEADPIASLRPDIPEGLAAVIHQIIAKDREQRPANAAAMAELLAPYADPRSDTILSRLRGAARGTVRPPSTSAPEYVVSRSDVPLPHPAAATVVASSPTPAVAAGTLDRAASTGVVASKGGTVASVSGPKLASPGTSAGVARDPSAATTKRSPLLLVGGAFVVVGLVGGAVLVKTLGARSAGGDVGPDRTNPTPTAAPNVPSATATGPATTTTPTTTTTAAASASASAPAGSTAPSASASAPSSTPHVSHTGTTAHPPAGPSPGLSNAGTVIKQ